MKFSVAVNTTGQTISVRPSSPAAPLTHELNVTHPVTIIINDLSAISTTTMWISVIGDTFVHKIDDVEAEQGNTSTAILQGITVSLSSIIYSTLEAISAARLKVLNDAVFTTVEAQYIAVVFGSIGHIHSILSVTLTICIIYVSELLRTCSWRQLPRFKFIDIKSVVIGSSIDDDDIANQTQSLHWARYSIGRADTRTA